MYFWLENDKIIFYYPNTVGFYGFSRILVDYQVYLTASAQPEMFVLNDFVRNFESQREVLETVKLSSR